MREYIARARDGRPLAVLVAESQTDAWLYALRSVRGYSHLEALKPIEEVVADATASFRGMGLSDKQAQIAAEGMRELRPHVRRIEVARQEPRLLADSRTATRKAGTEALREITPQKGAGQPAVELREAPNARKALEESWRALHPEWSDAQIRVAVEGR